MTCVPVAPRPLSKPAPLPMLFAVVLGGLVLVAGTGPAAAAVSPAAEVNAGLWENPLLMAGGAAEADLGRRLHKELLSGGRYGAPVSAPRAEAVFGRLLPVAGAVRDNIPYTLTVFQDGEPTAFALPGGFVYATTGLVETLNDDQLAGVLAHELAHTVYSHSLLQASVMNSLEQLARILLPEGDPEALLADIGRSLLALGYSRSQEAEADKVGQAWASEAGFDPYGLPQALRLLDGESSSGGVTAYLSSHPATAERVARLEALAAANERLAANERGTPDEPAPARPSPAPRSGSRLIALVALLVAALAQALHG